MQKKRHREMNDLDDYQRAVLAGLYARRAFDQGYRLSKLQKQGILNDYLTELNSPPGSRRARTARPSLPAVADYRWQPPALMRRARGR